MRKIGLIGGVGWRSTQTYYRILNEEVARRLGGLRSPRLAIESLDFAEVRALVDAGREDELRSLYLDATLALKSSGAQVLALCSNAAHTRLPYLEEAAKTSFVHIAAPLVREIRARRYGRVLLLGTRETMERDFMKDALAAGGAQVVVPDEIDRLWLHSTIFGDLERGTATTAQKARLCALIADHGRAGADAAILGCTELPLLVGPGDTELPCLDTTQIHASALIDAALKESSAP